MHVFENLPDLIGNTPMLKLVRSTRAWGTCADIYAKLEYFNPLGSVKDRVALEMITDAEDRGVLQRGGLVIEPTSGNTGIGLAYVCRCRGYRLILTMPESMSAERRKLLAALGAELVLTPAAQGMSGAVEKAHQLQQENPGSFIPDQFGNEANCRAHEKTTAPEILRDMDGKVDIFVATFGTGGTVTGNGRALKRANPACKVVAVEPADSPLLSAGWAGPHKLQGIGANFIPEILDRSVLDEVVTVTADAAFEMCRFVAQTEGLLVGISSGAALAAAKEQAMRPENTGKHIVVILPDTGERYLSSGLY